MNITVLSGRIRFNHQTFFHHNIKIDDIAAACRSMPQHGQSMNSSLVSWPVMAMNRGDTSNFPASICWIAIRHFLRRKEMPRFFRFLRIALSFQDLGSCSPKKRRTKTWNLQAENPENPNEPLNEIWDDLVLSRNVDYSP